MSKNAVTEQQIEAVPMLPSAVNVLEQMQPGQDWYKRRLEMALAYIDRQALELRDEHAALIKLAAEYGKLAQVMRDYLADPHTTARLLVEFYLAKAPK
jgi:hypothetical protein